MNIIKKISDRFLLTRTEATIFLFLSVVLLVGSGYRYFSGKFINTNQDTYNDSLLIAAGTDNGESADQKDSDYKEDVLDLKTKDWGAKKVLPKENSIDINTAQLEELISLPGIGNKTAKSIMDFRSHHGRINNANELIEVKGIGEAKLNKIRKYLTIK